MTMAQRRKRGTGYQLRDVVIRAATDLLAERGDVDALTMREVAAAAGVTPPSVYRHFPDKQTLVRAVIGERFAWFTNRLTEAGSTSQTPLTRLEAMSRAYVHTGLHQPGHYRVLFSATNAGPAGLGLPVDVEHPGAASHRALVEAVAACLPPRRHISQTAPPATELATEQATELATELWASLHGIVDLRITKPDMPWPDPNALVDAALAAVRAATTPS